MLADRCFTSMVLPRAPASTGKSSATTTTRTISSTLLRAFWKCSAHRTRFWPARRRDTSAEVKPPLTLHGLISRQQFSTAEKVLGAEKVGAEKVAASIPVNGPAG